MEVFVENGELLNRLSNMIKATWVRPTQVARIIGVSQGNMSLTLHGKRLTTWDMLVKVLLAFPELNPLYMLYGGEHEVLIEKEDFMPLVCKQSKQVLYKLMERFNVNVVSLCGFDDLAELREVATDKRTFNMREVMALHRLYPEVNIYWLMTGKGAVMDPIYFLLKLESKK